MRNPLGGRQNTALQTLKIVIQDLFVSQYNNLFASGLQYDLEPL